MKKEDIKIRLTRKNAIIVLIGLLIVCFFISLFSLLFIENKNERIILSFPHARKENVLVHRERIALKTDNRVDQIKEVIHQLGLGPNEELRDKCYSIFPLGMRAKSVIVNDKKVFIELPKDFIFYEADLHYNVDQSVEILRYNLKENFNWISELIVTVDGDELLNWDSGSKT